MALSKDTLATELEKMVNVDTEAEGNANFATAFENYFLEATCGGKSVEDDSLAACTTALKGVMTGSQFAGAASMAAGITAFWGVVATAAASIWIPAPPLASATPPTGLSGLAAAISAAGLANIADDKNKEDSCAAMAAAIHPLMLGGFGVNTATPPVSIPIL